MYLKDGNNCTSRLLTIQDFEALCPSVNRRSLQRDLKGMINKKLITAEGATNQLVYHLDGRFGGVNLRHTRDKACDRLTTQLMTAQR